MTHHRQLPIRITEPLKPRPESATVSITISTSPEDTVTVSLRSVDLWDFFDTVRRALRMVASFIEKRYPAQRN